MSQLQSYTKAIRKVKQVKILHLAVLGFTQV